MASASLDTLEFTVEDRCVKTYEAGSDMNVQGCQLQGKKIA